MGDTPKSSPILLTTYFETKLEHRYFNTSIRTVTLLIAFVSLNKDNVIVYCFFEKN